MKAAQIGSTGLGLEADSSGDATRRGVLERLGALWPRSLWARLALVQMAALAPLVVLLIAAIAADGRRVLHDVERQAHDAARLGAARQDMMLRETANLLRVLARVPAVRSGGGDCGSILLGAAERIADVSSIMLTDAQGTAFCSSRQRTVGLSYANHSVFAEAKALQGDGAYALSEIATSRIDGKPLVFMAIPLGPDNPAHGVMIAALHLDWFSGLQKHRPIVGNSIVQVFDSRDGVVLAQVPGEVNVAGMRVPEAGVVKAFAAAPAGGSVMTEDLRGTQRIFGFAPLPGRSPGLLIAVGVSATEVYAQIHRRMAEAIGLGLSIIAVSVFISWRISVRNLVRPLRTLSDAATQLGSGDTSANVDLGSDAAAELRVLADTFRQMITRLQARDARIQAMQHELAQSEGMHRLLADTATDMITRFSSDLRRMYVSPASREVLGYAPDELVGRMPGEIVHRDDWERLDVELNQALLSGQPTARATYRAIRKDGTHVWLESHGRSLGDGEGFVVVTRDVTERKALEEQLATANCRLSFLARQDALTGLNNRRQFDEDLDHEYRQHERTGQRLAVLLLDVDRFKLFNDTYGHPAGDACLQRVATALERALFSPLSRAARYGGEEFAVLLPDADETTAMDVAQRIQEAIRAAGVPHAASSTGFLTVSIGVAIAGGPAPPGPAALVKMADEALYAAKRGGRNRIVLAARDVALVSG